MGEENLKDFAVNWIVAGLLLFSLLAFAISFMYNNNPTGLDDGTSEIFSSSSSDFSSKLQESPSSSDSLLNITSNTNPEVSDLGSRDSVAVSFGSMGSATSYWDSSKRLLGWVFSGTVGNILLGVFGGIMGIFSLFYIWRFIRNGL